MDGATAVAILPRAARLRRSDAADWRRVAAREEVVPRPPCPEPAAGATRWRHLAPVGRRPPPAAPRPLVGPATPPTPLGRVRLAAGLTPRGAARVTGLGAARLARIERGGERPDAAALLRLALAYGVPPSAVLAAVGPGAESEEAA